MPVILVAVALLWVPGGLLAAGLGAGRWPSIALAPALTTSLTAVGGIVCGVLHVRWDLASMLVVLLVLPAAVLLVRLLLVRAVPVRPSARPPRGRRQHPGGLQAPAAPVREIVIGGAIAAAVAAATVVRGLAHPGDFPQQPDTIYHLGIVRYLLDTGSISSLTADGFNFPQEPSFYPAAFHGVAASLVLLTHAPGIIAVQCLLLVTAALVWPVGLMFLMTTVFPGNRPLVLVSGALASAIPGFPFLLSVWGPVWPLEYGYALIPAVLAVVALGLSQAFGGRSWASAAVLLVVALPGMSLAHTSATFAAAVGGFALAAAECWRFAHDPSREASRKPVRRWLPLAVLILAGVAGLLASTAVAPQGMLETSYDRVDVHRAVTGLLSLWAQRRLPFQLGGAAVLVLAVLGVVVAAVRRQGVWLAATWVLFLVLGFLTSFLPGSLTWPLTWPWYNLQVRVQGVAAVYGVPLVAVGVAWLVRAVPVDARPLRRVGRVAVIVVVAGVVALQALGNAYAISRITRFGGTYAWADATKIAALREFSRILPDNAVVAADPWKGGMYLYVVGPEDTLIHTEKSWESDGIRLAAGLDRLRSDPAICAAVHRTGVTHVITGGSTYVTAGARTDDYAGIDDVTVADGFEVVDRAGPYTLWAVPSCQE